MGRLPALKPRRVLQALLRGGFTIHHQSGSHVQLRHAVQPSLRVTVPRHDRFDLPPSILRVILKQAHLTVDEFMALV